MRIELSRKDEAAVVAKYGMGTHEYLESLGYRLECSDGHPSAWIHLETMVRLARRANEDGQGGMLWPPLLDYGTPIEFTREMLLGEP